MKNKEIGNRQFPFVKACRALVIGLAIGAACETCAQYPSLDSLSYFFEHSVYLENLNTPGSWWANPSLIAPIDKTTLYCSSVFPLGGIFTMYSVRALFPVTPSVNAGVGISGTGINQNGSISGSENGAQFSSNSSFSRPSFEAGICYSTRRFGSCGLVAMGGTESIEGAGGSASSTYYFWGANIGWLSPTLFNLVQLSLSTLTVSHSWYTTIWSHDARAGLLFNYHDGAVLGSAEYGFSLDTVVPFFRFRTNAYEVAKLNLSLRVYSIAGILLGFSKDAPASWFDNGPTYHLGAELRRSDIYPYYGGYEMGICPSPTRGGGDLALIHRIWVGYGFLKKS